MYKFHCTYYIMYVTVIDGMFIHTFIQYMYITCMYSGPSIVKPSMGPRKCGLILQLVLK